MVVLDTCKNEEVLLKNEGARAIITFLPLKVYVDFSRAANSAVSGLILSNFKPIQDFRVVLITCKKTSQSKKKALECS